MKKFMAALIMAAVSLFVLSLSEKACGKIPGFPDIGNIAENVQKDFDDRDDRKFSALRESSGQSITVQKNYRTTLEPGEKGLLIGASVVIFVWLLASLEKRIKLRIRRKTVQMGREPGKRDRSD